MKKINAAGGAFFRMTGRTCRWTWAAVPLNVTRTGAVSDERCRLNTLLSAVSTSSLSSGLTNSLILDVGGPPGTCKYRPADSDKWRMR